MGFISEFKEFAVKGNVVDLAVGVIIGAAFGKIVSSFVADIVTPLLSLLTGGHDFSRLGVVLRADPDPAKTVVLKYGVFLQSVFDFFLVALAIFVAIKAINRLKREQPAPPPPPPPGPTPTEVLLVEIRDLLRTR
ncbi:MAG: large-conductance mechanosensitive channel protein MscL [Myxococcales bacterium]|nr:large-conductance mechanosensitive channel protein MscL [Myxococcales bacterium]